MAKFDKFLGLKLSYQIFAPSEQFSTNIKAVDITVQEAMKGTNLLTSHLTSMQTEHMFNRFYNQTIQESKSLTEKAKLPRNRKLPCRIDHGSSASHHRSCAKDRYRQIYYETIDTVIKEVRRRFDQSDICLIRESKPCCLILQMVHL